METREFVADVGAWAKKNFDTCQNPWLGMVEEVGEMSHCLLKRFQMIRGFENENYFRERLLDAIGDFGIYAAHYAHMEGLNMYLGVEATTLRGDESMNGMINEVLYRLTLLHDSDKVESKQMHYGILLRTMKSMSRHYEINFSSAVLETWQHIVSKRNWVAAPQDGGV